MRQRQVMMVLMSLRIGFVLHAESFLPVLMNHLWLCLDHMGKIESSEHGEAIHMVADEVIFGNKSMAILTSVGSNGGSQTIAVQR